MYIDRIFDENIGPIEKLNIEFPFNESGLPKPIIFVGENGSGKSTLLSNIVDSLYSIANKQFDNAMQSNDNGKGNQYYKAISPIEIKIGADYLYSYIHFKNDSTIQYLFKSGNLSTSDFKTKVPNSNSLPFSWKPEDNFKDVKADKKEVEKIFDTDAICYFGPYRYEKPMWMGEKYFNFDENLHPSVQAKWAGKLINPITIKNVTETNLQWLMDVIVDSRPDIEKINDELAIPSHINVSTMLTMGTARKNLETILSNIVGKNVYFSLNLRNSGGSRFKIVESDTNNVYAPTLDSLSTGQIALFNMFSTIVRYADNNDLNKSVSLSEISGIVVIDEIELHLHTSLQKEVLPKLIKLFPKVQFVITSHAPLFLLGMQEIFGEDGYEIYEMPTATKISVERFSEFQRAYEYFKTTQTYQKDAEEAILKARPSAKAFIITEGSTDWKHMHTALAVLKANPQYTDIFDNLNIEFFEYEPKNSGGDPAKELEMGKDTLRTLCKNVAKIPQKIKYIFIADNDDPDTTKEMSAKDKSFKDWSNNVYSFVLPVPASRHETPNICIEHLYSDAEIKTEVEESGVLRRLHMGNEFDSRGLATKIDRICEKARKCGPKSIDIIEGSKGEKVTAISDSEGKTNYALPKTSFAKYVFENPDKFNFDNFAEIFRIIKAIIEDGETPCQNNQQQ